MNAISRRLRLPSRFAAVASCLVCVCTCLVVATPAEAQTTRTWITAGTGTWSNGNWGGSAPTANDLGYFSGTAVGASDVSVLFGTGPYNIAGLIFNNAGAVAFRSLSTSTRVIGVGASGLTVNSGAGAATIGVSGSNVNVTLLSSQTWTNNSANLLSIVGAVNTATSAVVGSDLTVAGSGPTTISGAISGSTGRAIQLFKQGAGTLTLSASNSYSGATTLSGGVLSLANANALAGGGNVTFSGGTLQYASGITTDLSARIKSSSGAMAIDTGSNAAITFASVIDNSNVGGLTKTGTGSLRLSAANSYTGATTISAGTLALDSTGSIASSATVTVGNAGSSGAVLDLSAKTSGFTFGSGQTVKGIGTIRMASGQALTLNGTLAAGNSPGTLTIEGGDLVLGGSSITSYEISGTDNTVGSGINDLTRVAGSLTLGGTLNVLATPAFDLFGSRTYRVFDYATGGSGSLGGSMSIGSTPDANYLYSLNTATAGQINLFVQRRADQAISFTLSPVSSRVLVGGSTSLSGVLANSSPTGAASLAWNPTVTGSLSSVTSSLGSSITAGGTSTVTATFLAGNTAGSQNWSIVNTDTSAITTSSTAAGSISVVNQRSFIASNSGTISLGNFLRTSAVSGSTTISSNGLYATTASGTLGVFFVTGTNTGGFSLVTLDPTAFNGGSENQSALYTLSGSAASAGAISGSFTANVSAELGAIDPVAVTLVGTAYDPAKASFLSGTAATTSLLLDFGSVQQNAIVSPLGFDLWNLVQTSGYTADLALTSIVGTGNVGVLTTTATSTFNTLASGSFNPYSVSFADTSTVGSFQSIYTFQFKSSNNGSIYSGDTPQTLTLTVQGVIIVPEPGAIALAGIGIGIVGWSLRKRRGMTTSPNASGPRAAD